MVREEKLRPADKITKIPRAQGLRQVQFSIGLGREFRDGQSYTDVIDDYRCYLQEIPKEKFRAYLGWDLWFYGGTGFEAVQMLWPSIDHVYSWEDRASEFLKSAQEILTKIPARVS